MDLAEVTQRMQSALAGGGFDKKVKFDFGSTGKLLIDGPTNTVTNDDGAADATIQVDFEDFKSIAQGTLDPMMAFMSGKLKVTGDMAVAMKLQSLFSKLR